MKDTEEIKENKATKETKATNNKPADNKLTYEEIALIEKSMVDYLRKSKRIVELMTYDELYDHLVMAVQYPVAIHLAVPNHVAQQRYFYAIDAAAKRWLKKLNK